MAARSSKTTQSDPSQIIKEVLSSATPPNNLLLVASELVRRQRLIDKVLSTFAKKETLVSKFKAPALDSKQIAKLNDQMRTVSLFAAPTFLIIDEVDEANVAVVKDICSLIDSSNSSNFLILTAASLANAHPITTAAQKKGKVIKLEKLDPAKLQLWIRAEFERCGLPPPSAAVTDALIQLAEHNADRIAAMVDHLATYLDGAAATPADLHALFPGIPEVGEFELLERVQNPNPYLSELTFSNSLAVGKSPFMILGMLVKVFANQHLIRSGLDNGLSQDQIRERLGMNPWVFKKNVESVRSVSKRKTLKRLRALVRADSLLKNRSLGPELIFSSLFESLRSGRNLSR